MSLHTDNFEYSVISKTLILIEAFAVDRYMYMYVVTMYNIFLT